MEPQRFVPRIRDRWTRAFVILGVAWFAGYFLAANPSRPKRGVRWLSVADGQWMYLQLTSLVLDGDWDFEDDYEVVGFAKGKPKWKIWLGSTRTGKPNDPWTLGTPFLLAPFFVVGHGLATLGRAMGLAVRADGLGLFEQYVTFLGSAVYGLLGLLLVFRMARRRFGPLPAFLAVVATALASPVAFFSLLFPSYSHAAAFFLVACLLELWDARLRRWRVVNRDGLPTEVERATAPSAAAWGAYGIAVGAAALVRPQLVLFGLPGALSWLAWAWRAARVRQTRVLGRLGAGGLLAVAAALLVFSPQLLLWKHLYGSYVTVPQGRWFMQWRASFMWEVLFSARSGLFPHSPVLLAGLVGWLVWSRRLGREAALFVSLVLLMAYVNGAAWDWWAGGTYGARRMTCTVGLFMVGAAGLVKWVWLLAHRHPRRLGWAAAGLLFAPILLFAQWEMWSVSRNGRMSSHWPDRDMSTYACKFCRWFQRTLGNPVEYPRSLWVWLSDGVPPGLYSRVVTDIPLAWPPRWMAPTSPAVSQVATLDLTTARWRKLVASGAKLKKVGRKKVWVSTRRCVHLYLVVRISTKYRLSLSVERSRDGQDTFSLRVGRRGFGSRHLHGARGWLAWILARGALRPGLNHVYVCGERPGFRLRKLRIAYVR